MSLSKTFLRSPYNYDLKSASDESSLICTEPTLTQQQFRDDSDPNKIMELFARDPLSCESLLHAGGTPQFGDFADSVDYHTSLNRVRAADSAFNSLPARVRSRFENDPAKLLDFISNSDNADEAFKLGLIKTDPSFSTPAKAIHTALAGDSSSSLKPPSS